MSSKEQFKDALKRANVVNAELKKENERLSQALQKASNEAIKFQRELTLLKKKSKMKWWKFWYKPYKK